MTISIYKARAKAAHLFVMWDVYRLLQTETSNGHAAAQIPTEITFINFSPKSVSHFSAVQMTQPLE